MFNFTDFILLGIVPQQLDICYIQFVQTMKNDQTTELLWSIEFYVI